MFTNPLSKKRYSVAIRFKSKERAGVDGVMPISEYRRMVADYRLGKLTGTYGISLDNIDSELTFPLQEIDTVHAVPEVVTDERSRTTD